MVVWAGSTAKRSHATVNHLKECRGRTNPLLLGFDCEDSRTTFPSYFMSTKNFVRHMFAPGLYLQAGGVCVANMRICVSRGGTATFGVVALHIVVVTEEHLL